MILLKRRSFMSANNTVCWVDVPVHDLDRAIRFYSAVLGAQVKKESFGEMSFGLLPHADSNVSGCLTAMADAKPSTDGPLVYFSVDGRLDAAIEAVSQNGGVILRGRHPIGPHGHRAIVKDTEGNRIALHSQS
jgi:hypothetical protein